MVPVIAAFFRWWAPATIAGEGRAWIRCSARDVLELAADAEQYRRVDTKIARVLSTHRVPRRQDVGAPAGEEASGAAASPLYR
jgi:hypothetical protein